MIKKSNPFLYPITPSSIFKYLKFRDNKFLSIFFYQVVKWYKISKEKKENYNVYIMFFSIVRIQFINSRNVYCYTRTANISIFRSTLYRDFNINERAYTKVRV